MYLAIISRKAIHQRCAALIFVALAIFSGRVEQVNAATTSSTNTKPGFNCAKGHSKNEQLICNDPELSRIDHELSLLYAQAKLATRNSTAFKKTNNEEWLWREKNCHDKNCLLQWYANRHNQLAATLTKRNANSSSSPAAQTGPSVIEGNSTTEETQSTTTPSNDTLSQQLVTLPLIKKPILWGIVIGIVLFISLAWDALGTDKQAKKRTRMIAMAVNSNIDAFLEQHGQSSHAGDMYDPKKWDREKRRFIEDMVKPSLTDCAPLSVTDVDRLCLIIDYVAWGVKHHNSSYKFRGDLEENEHGGYQQFCARVLKHHGWKVKSFRTNKPDGYLLATRKSHQAVVLCKAQSLPVGLEALREAHSLQKKHKAGKAVVISNAPFTTSVEREAATSGALLVNHLGLSMLAAMVEL